MGPSVRNLLSHYCLKPEQITSTGPHNTILKGDVLEYIGRNNLKPGQSTSADSHSKPKVFTPNLDLSGYQPKKGPEGYSRIAKELLKM